MRNHIIEDVRQEMNKAHLKHGPVSHSGLERIPHAADGYLCSIGNSMERAARTALEREPSTLAILAEEVGGASEAAFKAANCPKSERKARLLVLYGEVVQVAAMAFAWLEVIEDDIKAELPPELASLEATREALKSGKVWSI